jgi:hypothetical protein
MSSDAHFSHHNDDSEAVCDLVARFAECLAGVWHERSNLPPEPMLRAMALHGHGRFGPSCRVMAARASSPVARYQWLGSGQTGWIERHSPVCCS